jgi:hypothetical protein
MSYALRLDWLFYEDLSEALKNRRDAVVIPSRTLQQGAASLEGRDCNA